MERLEPADGWPKRCSCCEAKLYAPAWAALRYVGIMSDDFESIELRQCTCGTTLSVELR